MKTHNSENFVKVANRKYLDGEGKIMVKVSGFMLTTYLIWLKRLSFVGIVMASLIFVLAPSAGTSLINEKISGDMPSFSNLSYSLISPDGQHVIYIADQVIDEVAQLWSVPIDGSMPPTPLSFQSLYHSHLPQISSDSSHVVFLSENRTLYSVAITGGPPIQLYTLQEYEYINTFSVSLDSNYVVFVVDSSHMTQNSLYSVALNGGNLTQFDNPTGGLLGQWFEISPNSSYVVYQIQDDLYSASITGGTPVKLSDPDSIGGLYSEAVISPDSSHVVYITTVGLFSSPLTGGTPLLLHGRSSLLTLWRIWEISGNNNYVLYQAEGGLYSVHINGGTPNLLFDGNAFLYYSSERHQYITPDSSRVIFATSETSSSAIELYSIPLTGGTSVKLNGPDSSVVINGSSRNYQISPDSSRVVYLAHPDTNNTKELVGELYSVPLIGGSPIKLNGLLHPNSYVREWGALIFYGFMQWAPIDPSSNFVVYQARHINDTEEELYIVPINGGTPIKVSLLSHNGLTSIYDFSPDGNKIVYQAHSTVDPFPIELYVTYGYNEALSVSISPSLAGNYFLENVSVHNQIDAQVVGNSSLVIFDLNGNETQQIPTDGVASTIYDMGSDLDYSLGGTANQLTITAAGNDGTSATDSIDFVGVIAPSWLSGTPTVIWSNPGEPVTYKFSTMFPVPPFEANTTPPDWIPFLGGQPLGILSTQGTLVVTASSDGVVASQISGQSGFGMGNSGIGLTISGNGSGSITEGAGLQLETADINIHGDGQVELEKGVADVIPGLKDLEETPIIGKVIKWFNEVAKLKAVVEAAVGLAFNFKSQPLATNPDDSELIFEAAEGTISNGAEIALVVSLIDEITAEGRGGGGVQLTAQVPANPLYIKDVATQLFAELILKIWRFEKTFSETVDWNASFNDLEAHVMADIKPTELALESNWEPIQREYGSNAASYSVFQANQLSAPPESERENQSDAEIIIASNVFPDGHPSLATGESTMIVWVHDDINRPLMQGEEIRYTVFDGISWSSPQNITDDSLQDFHPQVAFTVDNQAVAIWERNKYIQSVSSELNSTYTNAFEIAYAVWDGQNWSVPALLTNNEIFDHAPQLIQGNDGQLFALWQQNEAGELLSDTNTPDTIIMARWLDNGWATPQAVTTVSGLLDYSFARHNNNKMSLIYSQDTDNDYSTIVDQELFQLNWDGVSWDSPVRLTNDAYSDDKPSLFYSIEGQPKLLWMKGETLYGLIDDLTGQPRIVLTESSVSMMDYTALRNQDDNLVIFWQDYSEEGVDIWYAVYNRSYDAFGPRRQLTQNEPLEKMMSPTFAPNGDIMIAYDKTELLVETVEISPTLTIENVITFGETDLVFQQTTINYSPFAGIAYLPVIFRVLDNPE